MVQARSIEGLELSRPSDTLDQRFQGAFKSKKPSQDERAKRAKAEEPLVTLDHSLVLEPVRLHVKLFCEDKRGPPI